MLFKPRGALAHGGRERLNFQGWSPAKRPNKHACFRDTNLIKAVLTQVIASNEDSDQLPVLLEVNFLAAHKINRFQFPALRHVEVTFTDANTEGTDSPAEKRHAELRQQQKSSCLGLRASYLLA